jgi:hypothetical protein
VNVGSHGAYVKAGKYRGGAIRNVTFRNLHLPNFHYAAIAVTDNEFGNTVPGCPSVANPTLMEGPFVFENISGYATDIPDTRWNASNKFPGAFFGYNGSDAFLLKNIRMKHVHIDMSTSRTGHEQWNCGMISRSTVSVEDVQPTICDAFMENSARLHESRATKRTTNYQNEHIQQIYV